ncbi:thiamine ABC transporter substrate binding subunit [Natrialbaceae archaeon A-arb3/5]
MRRRTAIRAVASGSIATVAGCFTRGNGNAEENGGEQEDDSTLRVATYSSMVTGETPAGEWIAEAFEEQFPDIELTWTIPEAGIDNYLQRARLGAPIDADVFLGLTLPELARADDAFSGRLFEPLDRDRLDRHGRVRPSLAFDDPQDRVLTYDTGFLSLVYNETVLDPPETFTDLLEPEYTGALLMQDPRQSDPGLGFLLWTIAEFGEDAPDYWESLRENNAQVYERWTDTYVDAYLEMAGPMVVSYSTDQVDAVAADRDLDRHRIATIDGRGYQLPEGVAVFDSTGNREYAYEFIDFLLSNEAQAEIARRNVQFPAVEPEGLELGPEFATYAQEPEERIQFGYEELRGSIQGWIDAWAEEWSDELEDDDELDEMDEPAGETNSTADMAVQF